MMGKINMQPNNDYCPQTLILKPLKEWLRRRTFFA